ncbi:NDR1/HIN1-like protein 13 [Rhodamnia argentea]|uniref:NDR1/HIN1-like protein 13 n=1 Tax=Rhodamnia argentea TaxID=178133 RepID=A0A8B8QDF1_9MYRT|nr:NDR1/HIN1-like protein 13 [Rhodamnia argentea]
MEERFSPPPHASGRHGGSVGGGDHEANPDLTLVPKPGNPEHVFASDTYVVQIPKDQIYRVPPPENALIVERHRKPAGAKKRSWCCSSCCCCLFVTVIVIFLALGVLAVVSSFFLKLKNPNFHVDHFLVKNLTKSHDKNTKLAYDVKLKVENPNPYTSFIYEQGGVISLSFKQKAVATGKFTPFDQDRKSSKAIDIVLNGSNTALPKEMQKSLTSDQKTKNHVTFALRVDVPARRKIWKLNGSISRYVASCQFTVDTLGKDARVLSQSCETEREDL